MHPYNESREWYPFSFTPIEIVNLQTNTILSSNLPFPFTHSFILHYLFTFSWALISFLDFCWFQMMKVHEAKKFSDNSELQVCIANCSLSGLFHKPFRSFFFLCPSLCHLSTLPFQSLRTVLLPHCLSLSPFKISAMREIVALCTREIWSWRRPRKFRDERKKWEKKGEQRNSEEKEKRNEPRDADL